MSLFIGGPCDGERRHVQEHLRTYRVISSGARPALYVTAHTADEAPAELAQFEYWRHRILDSEVFAPSGMRIEEIIAKLIAAYPPRS